MSGWRSVWAGRSTEDHVSDARPSKPGPSKPGVRFGDVPVLALLAAAAVLGYVALDLGERAPAMPAAVPAPEAASPPPIPALLPAPADDPVPVADPSPIAGSPDAETPVAAPVEEPLPAPTAPVSAEPAVEPVVAEPILTEPVLTEPVTAEPAATEPVTAEMALGNLRDALAGARCAELRVDLVDGALNVAGTVTSVDDRSRVQQLIDALPAGLARPPVVAVASSALCEPLSLLEPLRSANAARGTPLTVATVAGDSGFTAGQDLVLDLRAPDMSAHLQVDYFTVDGGVVHLLPNPLEPVARLEAGATRRLGERSGRTRFWTIGPPFGHELIVVVASGAPLFPVPRPEAEPAAAYLPELKRALTGPGTEGGLAAALFIATRAP